MKKHRSIIDEDAQDIVVKDEVKENFKQRPTVPVKVNPKNQQKIKNLEQLTMCPRCNKPLVPAIAINGNESTSFKECPSCGTLVNTFRPTPYQAIFLKKSQRYKMTAGGYGSGKSRSNLEHAYKHLMLIPHSRIVVVANTYPTIQGTFDKEFIAMFPRRLLKHRNEQKHEMSFTNGGEVIYRSFDDPRKLKSMNASLIIEIEASDFSLEGHNMVQSRLRNTAGLIPHYNPDGTPVVVWNEKKKSNVISYRVDARQICIETNPDSGWVKKFLLDSEYVQFFGDAYNEGYTFNKVRDPNKYTQIVSTNANPYLPEGYEEEQTRGKDEAYIAQFFKGSFNFSSFLVLPNFGLSIKAPHALPPEFDEMGRRKLYYLVGADYGVDDNTHFIFMAFSTVTRKLYVFDELYMNNSDVKTLSKAYRKAFRANGTSQEGLLMLPRFDGRSYNKRESTLKTIGEMFEAEGLYFEPSFASWNTRIIKTNALINSGQLEVFSNCERFIEEGLNFKWKLDKHGKNTGKPKDGNDHGITACTIVISELPPNLHELKLSAYIPIGASFKHDMRYNENRPKPKEPTYDPFKEDSYDRSTVDYSNNLVVSAHHSGGRVFSVYDENDEDEDDEVGGRLEPLRAYTPER